MSIVSRSPDRSETHGLAPVVSIVVISHNYDAHLATAVESALAQTYPSVEVVAIDDGSTDGSQSILDSYRPRVRTLYKTNGGNSSVVNASLSVTSGDIVMFLDADDYLDPAAAASVVEAWEPGCAKVQFRLTLVDAQGERRGVDPPESVAMPNGDVLPQLLAAGEYVTPVMTGNAFSRHTLERLLPIPECDFRNTNDGYLNPLCAFEGPIVSLDRELGAYRLHGQNLWAFSGEVSPQRIRERVEHDLVRERYLSAAARSHGYVLDGALCMRRFDHVLMRLISLRIDGSRHPVRTDTALGLVRAGAASLWRDARTSPAGSGGRLLLLLTVALSPPPLARRIATGLLASRPRPEWLRRLRHPSRFLGRA